MQNEIFDYLVLLEKALADFYKGIRKNSPFERIKSVLEFMETHSSQHAEQINGLNTKYTRPVIDKNIILDEQNNITKKVNDIIRKEDDLLKILKNLADSEESLGVMYKKYANYLVQLSQYYKDISSEIDRIAEEEYNHRDILLNDRDKLMDKSK